jgi:hypothetical protein
MLACASTTSGAEGEGPVDGAAAEMGPNGGACSNAPTNEVAGDVRELLLAPPLDGPPWLDEPLRVVLAADLVRIRSSG